MKPILILISVLLLGISAQAEQQVNMQPLIDFYKSKSKSIDEERGCKTVEVRDQYGNVIRVEKHCER